MPINTEEKTSKILYKSFLGGIAWAVGATLGFALLLSLLSFLFSQLGALPLVGNFFASIIEVTNQALENRILVR